jgi:hypothetical protein
MIVPKALRKQIKEYIAAGFHPTRIQSGNSSHFKVWFAEFDAMQIVTANINDPRSIQNNLARYRRLQQEQQEKENE